MKSVDWDSEKNEELKRERDISFEEVAAVYLEGKILDLVEHHNQEKYPHQKMFLIAVRGYVYVVPFVEDEERIFLKTIFPSRTMTQKYIFKRKHKKS